MGAAPEPGARRMDDMFSSAIGVRTSRYETLRHDVDDGLQLPHAVIASRAEIEDLVANVATYYATQSPLTALTHIIDRESVRFIRVNEPLPPSNKPRLRQLVACLGAAVGETFLAGLGSAETTALPSYAACRRSLGYALARASSIYPDCSTAEVSARWSRLRELSRLSSGGAAARAVETLHRTAFRQSLPDVARGAEVYRALDDYIAGLVSDERLLSALLSIYPQLQSCVQEMSGPFDARMKAFTEAAERIHVSPGGPELDGMALAFVCNLILPGSFAHARVLAKLVDFYPSALVWYGAFCAASKTFNLRQFGSGLIAKLLRDVEQPFHISSRPTSDIALEELDVLMRLPLRPESLKPLHQRTALVALLPGIEVFARVGTDEDYSAEVERDRRGAEAEETNSRLVMLLEDALSLVRRRGAPRVAYGTPRRQRKEK
jgi:hypothetical protein